MIEMPNGNISINLTFPSMQAPNILSFIKPPAKSYRDLPVALENSTERNMSHFISLQKIYLEQTSSDYITLPKIYFDDMHQVIMIFQ